MPAIRYVGPHDEVSVDGLGSVKRNESIDAPAALAGRAPGPADKEGVIADPGEGLLAQVDNWQPVKKSALANEGGPEVVNLPRGSKVTPSTDNDKQES